MTTTQQHIFRAALVGLALLILTATGAAAGVQERAFDVADGGLLKVDTDLGSIEVQASGSGQVDVVVETSGAHADELKVEFSQSGDEVRVRGDYRRSGAMSWGRSPRVKFRITVPERYNVDLRTSGGSISVSDLEGEVRTKTSGGSLSFGDIRGPVWGRTSGGSISLQSSVGDAEVETSGGSIRIGDVDGEVTAHTSGGSISIDRARGRVDADTSGGTIRVDEVMGTINASTSGGSVTAYISEQPEGDCRLTTSGGSVTVYLSDGIGVDLDARGGRVASDFPVSGGSKTKTSLTGTIGGGGPELYLRSSGGGVQVERR